MIIIVDIVIVIGQGEQCVWVVGFENVFLVKAQNYYFSTSGVAAG